MAKYSKSSQDSVKDSMHKMIHGKLKSGRSGRKVSNPKQTIAIGLSEAREKGAKVPKKTGTKNTSKKSTTKSAAMKSISNKSYSKNNQANTFYKI
ncbi:MAG: DUF6496 domain-containing protein [Ginsengibacter sp.]